MTSRFLGSHTPQLLVCSGFAGGLDPKIQTGEVVVADNVSTPSLLDTARSCFSKDVFFGALTSQLAPAETISEKQHLAATTGALAVDMETGWILEVCKAAGIPLLSLRGISDTALQSLPVPFSAWFDAQNQKARPVSLILYLLFHPAAIPPFVRFVRGIFKAKKLLSEALVKWILWMEKEGCSQA
jgi:adenosylhomocysteine nucleosidase